MANPLKKDLDKQFVIQFSKVCSKFIHNFNSIEFIANVINDSWEELEIKSRIRHISSSLHQQLPNNTSDNLKCIINISEDIRISKKTQDGFEHCVLIDYIQVYGMSDTEASIKAIDEVNKLKICEFVLQN
jgi:hypothetical protein